MNTTAGLTYAYMATLKLVLACAILLPASFASANTPARFSAIAAGPITSLKLNVTLSAATADYDTPNKTRSIFIAAKSAAGDWYYFSGAGSWLPRPATGLIPYKTYYPPTSANPERFPATLSVAALPVATDMTAWAGAKVYVGYGEGETDTEMFSKNRYRLVYTVAADADLRGLRVGDTDSQILHDRDAYHVFHDCAGPCADDSKLFVFLPGSNGSTFDHQKIAHEIGKTGVRVLVLAYQNNGSVQSMCGADLGCYYELRRERVEGSSSADPIRVKSVHDGIKNRLFKALTKLNADFPPAANTPRWSQYLSGPNILFEKIIIGGYSQGAGMAAWIGKHYATARVCQFAGTWDGAGTIANPVSAPWLSMAGGTASSSYYGFAHQHDTFEKGAETLNANWIALGMGPGLPATEIGPGVQKIRSFHADLQCNTGYGHECSVVDSVTPITDGNADFAPIWRHVCGR